MGLPDQQELLKIFSAFLFEAGLSAVSVKNYLSDIRHFLSFCLSSYPSDSEEPLTVKDIFSNPAQYLDHYIQNQKATFTPASTTARRLASIRRFSTFMSVKFGLSNIFTDQSISKDVNKNIQIQTHQNVSLPLAGSIDTAVSSNTVTPSLTSKKILEQFRAYLEREKKSHSTVKNYLSDLNHFFLWTARQTPFTDQNLVNILSEQLLQAYVTYLKLSHTSTSVINRRQSSIKKLSKFCFEQGYLPNNPFELKSTPQSLAPLAWIERLTQRSKKSEAPKGRLAIIYDRYSSLPWSPYFNLALLVLATTTMAILAYNQIISQARPSAAATALTPPRRQLSFQGRLTDSGGTPITTAVNVVFRLFNASTGPTQLYTSGTCSVTPDQDGIFNTLIGETGVCGDEINSSVFTDNRDVFLEIQVGGETLTPRQQIATVGFALNSETLQGYPASAAATINTVPVVDNDGNINISATSPSIISNSGTFSIEGQSLVFKTTTNSGGDIILQPDAIGSGQVLVIGGTTSEDSFRVTNANLTTGNLISGYVGNDTATGRLISLTSGSTETDRFWVAVDGRTSILASATNSALIVNQTGSGNLISASASGVPVFTVTNGGNVDISGQYLVNGAPLTASNWQRTSGSLAPLNISDSVNVGAIATGSAFVHLAGTSGENSFVNNGNFGIGLTNPGSLLDVSGDINLTGAISAAGDTGTSGFLLTSAGGGTNTWTDPASLTGGANFWQRNIGALSPANIWESLNMGGTATNSATVHLAGASGDNSFVRTGSFGIGMTNPSERLDVNGNVRFSGALMPNGAAGTAGQFLISAGAGAPPTWTSTVTASSISFSGITSGTNTTATMIIDTGASLNFSGSGTINASSLLGGTWAAPGTIGSGTPNTGAFTTLSSSGLLSANNGLNVTGYATVSASLAVGYTNAPEGPGHAIFAGNVGIGLTNPAYTLDVFGNINLSGGIRASGSFGTSGQVLSSTGTGVVWSTVTTSSDSFWQEINGVLSPINNTDSLAIGGTSTASALFYVDGVNGDASTSGSLVFHGTDPSTIDILNGNRLTFQNSPGGDAGLTPRFTIAGNGFVGVGITNPAYALDVTGDFNLTGALRDNGDPGTPGQILSSTGTGIAWIAAVSASPFQHWQRNDGVLSPTIITDDVAIGGTATSSALFHISGTTGAASSSSTLSFFGPTNPEINILNGENLNIQTSPGGNAGLVSRLTILNNGNVGIGVASPAQKLDILGNLQFSGALMPGSAAGTAGQFLISAGAGAPPTWTSTLNASTLQGFTWESPGTIGSTTPNTGAFTTLSSSGLLSANGGLNVTGYATISASLAVGYTNAPEGPGHAIFSGLVGIGVTNPSSSLEIGGSANIKSRTGDLTLTPAGNLIVGSGNLGVGVTNPGEKVDISGNLQFSGALMPNGAAGTSGQFLTSAGAGAPPTWTSTITATSVPFSAITSGANSTATMTVTTGATLTFSASGVINASTLVGDTWLAPGAIGSVTPNSGAFTSLSATGGLNVGGDATVSGNITMGGQLQLGRFAAQPTPVGIGSFIYNTTVNNPQYYNGTTWSDLSNYFSRDPSGFIYPSVAADSFHVGGTPSSAATALVRLAGNGTDYSFFMDPIAVGFNTGAITGAATMIEVDGDVSPHTTGGGSLGSTTRQWSTLSLSSGVFSGGTNIINTVPGALRLAGEQWNATIALRVGDTTSSMPTSPVGNNIKFYVNGDATASGNIGALGFLYVGGTSKLIGDVTIGGGNGKLDVGTVDPPYTINGEKYATYMAGMVGVKEEVTGKINAAAFVNGVGYKAIIDLENLTIGSDIWLFSKTTKLKDNLDNLSILLTPEGQAKVWYEIDRPNKKLSIYSTTPSDVSFRMTAPRFDTASWPNTRTGESVGFILNDSDPDQNNPDYDSLGSVIEPELIAQIDSTFMLKINGRETKEVSSFFQSIIANLKVGTQVVNDLVADNLTIRTKLVSPIADIDKLKVIDATISGTLYADNIRGKTVDSLTSQLNLLDEKYATASGILADLQAKYSSYTSLLDQFETATDSGDPLALSPLATTSANLPTDLALNSLTSETIYTQDLMATGSLFAQSLNSFDGDLYIQPTGDKPVHLLANLMTLYPDGKVVINGDLLITGILYASGLDTATATVSGTLALGRGEVASDSSKLVTLFDQDGRIVGSIDASGSANFGELITGGLIIASGVTDQTASVSAGTGSNTTIGTATIATGSAEISIFSNKVTDHTLIYLTPISDTSNQVLYVKSKQTGVGFTVAVPSTPNQFREQISFNYWLVETK